MRTTVIGYGNQGRAQALNLRDSGHAVSVVEPLRPETAREDGFVPHAPIEAVAGADVVALLLPDEVIPGFYAREVHNHLRPGQSVLLASGYVYAFAGLPLPDGTSGVMAAPRTIGREVRARYQRGEPVPVFVSVERDAHPETHSHLEAYAAGIGARPQSTWQVSARTEAELDLFSEQAVWPLIMSVFLRAYERLVAEGYPEEAVLVELYGSGEPGEVLLEAARHGIFEQLRFHSRTSQFGQLSRLEDVERGSLERFMTEALSAIRSGAFASRWSAAPPDVLDALIARCQRHPIASVERRVREALWSSPSEGP